MQPQQYCLRWKYHHNNLQAMFGRMLERESFCDVALACEGKTLRAHKVVLSACSTYFDAIFSQFAEERNPIVILKDVKFADIKSLVEFMYKGEINVDHSRLTTLLKTAEDLCIKGLAEVSSPWSHEERIKSEEPIRRRHEVMDTDSGSDMEPPNKRICINPDVSNGRASFNPKVASISGAVGTASAFTQSHTGIDNGPDEQNWDDSEPEVISCENEPSPETNGPPLTTDSQNDSFIACAEERTEGISQHIVEQYREVVKLNDYLTTGRRQQFWEEPFTRRIMEAIKGKELDMKTGAELLGVSYGTLYGRYRDAFGCLKHPYRVRDFWAESLPSDVLMKVQRKEITLFRAAEMLNVTVTTLANYLSTLRQGGYMSGEESQDGEEDSSMLNDEMMSVSRDSSTFSTSTPRSLATTALENNPDITIVRQDGKATEKIINSKKQPDVTIVKQEKIADDVLQEDPLKLDGQSESTKTHQSGEQSAVEGNSQGSNNNESNSSSENENGDEGKN